MYIILHYQLPNCNLFTQHVLFILWRDTTSELWTPIQFPLHSFTILLLLALFTFLHTIILLPLDTLNSLFTANRWDWQPHRKLGAKYLFVLCRFHVVAGGRHAINKFSGANVRSVMKLASITFWSLAFSYWFDKPWFHNWGKTCYYAHHTFLLGFPTGCTYKSSSSFLAPLPGRKKTSARGVSHAQSFALFLVLLYFIFACIFL
jgi:hypothetical protein